MKRDMDIIRARPVAWQKVRENVPIRLVYTSWTIFRNRAVRFRSFLRYGIIGVAQNAAAYCITLVLIAVGWKAWQVALVLSPLATVVSFFLNRRWSFESRPQKGQLAKYLFVYGVCYIFAVSSTWALEYIGVPSWLAALVTVCTAAMVIYGLLALWIFAAKPEPETYE